MGAMMGAIMGGGFYRSYLRVISIAKLKLVP